MIDINVRIKVDEKLVYADKDVKKATIQGLNRAAITAREEMTVGVFKKYALKKGDIKGQMSIHKASQSRLSSMVNVRNFTTRHKIPLSWFPFAKKPEGVQVEVFRGRRQLIRGAFWSRYMRQSVSTIMARVLKSRLPLAELTAADLSIMVLSVFKREMIDRIAESFNKNFAASFKYLRG